MSYFRPQELFKALMLYLNFYVKELQMCIKAYIEIPARRIYDMISIGLVRSSIGSVTHLQLIHIEIGEGGGTKFDMRSISTGVL